MQVPIRFLIAGLRHDRLSIGAMLFSIVVGATTVAAVGGIADALRLDPLPDAREAASLLSPHAKWPAGLFNSYSYRQFHLIRTNDSVRMAAAYTHRRVNIRGDGAAIVTGGALVSVDYFRILGVRQTAGYLFSGDDRTVEPNTVILSSSLAVSLFGEAGVIVGREALVNGVPFRVVGVVPRTFRGTELSHPCDAFFPLAAARIVYRSFGNHSALSTASSPDIPWLSVVARLRPGAERLTAARGIQRALGDQQEIALLPFLDTVIALSQRPQVRNFLLLLSALALLLWAAVVGNLLTLLLVRSLAERREMAVRLALGAPRFEIVFRRLTESLAIGVAGAALAVVASAWLLPFVSKLSLPGDVPVGELRIGLSGRTLANSLVAVFASSGLASVLTLRPGLNVSLAPLLNRQGPNVPPPRRVRSRLLTAQVVLSVVCLTLTGMIARQIRRDASAEPGFTKANVVLARLDLESLDYAGRPALELWDRLLTRIRSIPGVRSATVTTNYFGRGGRSLTSIWLDGVERPHRLFVNYVATDYFRTVGIPRQVGRDFTAGDTADAPRVTIINAAMAAALWPGMNPLDRTFSISAGRVQLRVVGIVANALQMKLGEETEAGLYVPLSQHPDLGAREKVLAVRTETPLAKVRDNISRELTSLEPNAAWSDVGTLLDAVNGALLPERTAAVFCGCVGLLSLLLVFAAVYGLVSRVVLTQTHEIGIRMSIGATPGHVVSWVVLSHLRRPLATGWLFGASLAVALSRLLSANVVGFAELGLFPLLLAAAIVTGVAACAALVPAVAAARVDPAAAIRG
jgi:predicted permease